MNNLNSNNTAKIYEMDVFANASYNLTGERVGSYDRIDFQGDNNSDLLEGLAVLTYSVSTYLKTP